MTSVFSQVIEMVGVNCKIPITTVSAYLKYKDAEDIISNPDLEIATRQIGIVKPNSFSLTGPDIGQTSSGPFMSAEEKQQIVKDKNEAIVRMSTSPEILEKLSEVRRFSDGCQIIDHSCRMKCCESFHLWMITVVT